MEYEIQFRGKRKYSGEWVYGSLCYGGDFLQRKVYILEKAYCAQVSSTERKELAIGGFVEINPRTVGQYIGTNDESGRRIFVGDLVQAVRGDRDTYKWLCQIQDIRSLPREMFGSSVKSLTVIGNIHDNPEILRDMKRPLYEVCYSGWPDKIPAGINQQVDTTGRVYETAEAALEDIRKMSELAEKLLREVGFQVKPILRKEKSATLAFNDTGELIHWEMFEGDG